MGTIKSILIDLGLVLVVVVAFARLWGVRPEAILRPIAGTVFRSLLRLAAMLLGALFQFIVRVCRRWRRWRR
jgi:hypothetical protein